MRDLSNRKSHHGDEMRTKMSHLDSDLSWRKLAKTIGVNPCHIGVNSCHIIDARGCRKAGGGGAGKD